jgi:hypothetical protein
MPSLIPSTILRLRPNDFSVTNQIAHTQVHIVTVTPPVVRFHTDCTFTWIKVMGLLQGQLLYSHYWVRNLNTDA